MIKISSIFYLFPLRRTDMKWSSSSTGLGGIALFFREDPDLIILDLGLPDIDGLNVIDEIRASSEVPIIIVSARGQEEEKVQALDRGADDYITKPFYIGELLARVRVSLRKRQPKGTCRRCIFAEFLSA